MARALRSTDSELVSLVAHNNCNNVMTNLKGAMERTHGGASTSKKKPVVPLLPATLPSSSSWDVIFASEIWLMFNSGHLVPNPNYFYKFFLLNALPICLETY